MARHDGLSTVASFPLEKTVDCKKDCYKELSWMMLMGNCQYAGFLAKFWFLEVDVLVSASSVVLTDSIQASVTFRKENLSTIHGE